MAIYERLTRRGPVRREGVAGLSEEDIHHVLSNIRRRLALEVLRENGRKMDMRQLSELVAEAESGESPAPRKTYQSVHVSLHQTHLPKLNDLGVVSYDDQNKEIQLAEGMSEVAVYMETVPKYGVSWSEFYIGVGLIGLLTVLGAVTGSPVLSMVDPIVWATLSIILVIAASAYQQQIAIFHRLRT